MKKFVLKLDLHDDKEKRKALKTVSTLPGIDSISMDMKGHKLTVIGSVDPINVVSKLRKFWSAEIILVGPVKEPENPKKEEGKKDEGKKEEPKKEEGKKEESKKDDAKKPEQVIGIMPNRPYYPYMNGMPYPPVNAMPHYPINAMPHQPVNAMPYRPYYPPPNTFYYANHSIEENPNGCVIS